MVVNWSKKSIEDIKKIEHDDRAGAKRVIQIDESQRSAVNSIFGERVVGIRRSYIASQFHYGIPSDSANTSTSNGGSVSVLNSMLTLSTSTNVAGYASISNKKALRYLPGHQAYMNFTAIFTQGVANSYQRGGLFDSNNGFFIGYEGETFCVTRRRDGVDENHEITLSEVFPECDGTFDPTKGNVYSISFGYLGFATITFEVLAPDGNWVVLHQIKYPNTSLVTHITNTNLQPRAEIANDGNNTDLILKSGSFVSGIVNGGGEDPASRKFSYSAPNQTITAGTYHYITFRSKTTFNSITNYIQTVLSLISIATDLSKNSVWIIRKNMTITNTPTWQDINASDSTIEYSTNATFTAGTGIELLPFSMGKVDRIFENILEQEIEFFPTDYITFVIKTPVGTTGTFDFALRWKELF